MKLKEWDYNQGPSGGWVETEHPDKIIKEFVEFALLNKQWPEQLEIMYNRFLKFKRDLTDARNDAALDAAKQAGADAIDEAIDEAMDVAETLKAAAGSVA